MTTPVVTMDESGNTGENLLDAIQPMYVLAAVRQDLPGLEAAVADARTQADAVELKFSALRADAHGQQIATELLSSLPLAGDAAIVVADKPWMLAAKLVDELIEPTMLARGHQMGWIQSGVARDTAEFLAHGGRRELGETYDELAQTFVALARRYTPDRARAFQRALGRCKIARRSPTLGFVLDDMISTDAALEDAFAGRADALDPGLTALFTQAGFWSSRLAVPFEICHDESTTVRAWADVFAEMRASRLAAEQASGRPTSETVQLGAIRLDVPVHLEQITFAVSERDASVQLADVLAGAAVYVHARRFGYRTADRFGAQLEAIGVGDLSILTISTEDA